MEKFGLTKEEINRIKSVLSGYEQVEKVLVYGSRAMGNHNPASDIDLTLIGKNINLALQHKIEFALDDLLLPYKFDLSIFDRITNPEFKAHIASVGRVFYESKNHREVINTGDSRRTSDI